MTQSSERAIAANYQECLIEDIAEMLSFARTSGTVIPADVSAQISDLFAEIANPAEAKRLADIAADGEVPKRPIHPAGSVDIDQ